MWSDKITRPKPAPAGKGPNSRPSFADKVGMASAGIKAQYERFFSEADKDKDGFLSFNELYVVLKKHGFVSSREELRSFFKLADTNGDNRISLQEFLIAMDGGSRNLHGEAQLRYVFRTFDKDGDGEIDSQELQSVLVEMGRYTSQEEMQRLIDRCDKDRSGTLNYEEFIDAIARDVFKTSAHTKT